MSQPKRPHQARGSAEQVAVVAVRRDDNGLEMCLIRRNDSAKWGIPKGFIDPGDTPEQAALNEALEEAGVEGPLIGDIIGTYDYTKWSARLTVAVYVMEVVEAKQRWGEMRLRDRRWYPVAEAATLLRNHPVQSLWDRVMERLATLRERGRRGRERGNDPPIAEGN